MVIAMKNDQQTSAPVCGAILTIHVARLIHLCRCPSIVVHEEVNGTIGFISALLKMVESSKTDSRTASSISVGKVTLEADRDPSPVR